MTVQQFAQAIEHLLLIGAIQEEAVMCLYYLLIDFEQGRIDADAFQKEVDQYDRDRLQP
jgi:hypothetical protein